MGAGAQGCGAVALTLVGWPTFFKRWLMGCRGQNPTCFSCSLCLMIHDHHAWCTPTPRRWPASHSLRLRHRHAISFGILGICLACLAHFSAFVCSISNLSIWPIVSTGGCGRMRQWVPSWVLLGTPRPLGLPKGVPPGGEPPSTPQKCHDPVGQVDERGTGTPATNSIHLPPAATGSSRICAY